MTVQPAFCPLSLQTLFDMNGCAIVGGQIFFYDAGTTNPRTAYKDQGLTVATTFPVLTDAYGRIPPVWIGLGPYKIVLKDNYGGLISTIDNLPGGVNVAATPAAAAQFQTGMVIFEHGDAIYDGFLPLNANTIGNANSTATGRANDDTNALFIHLWNKDPSLTVSGGRGISASADWSAAKTIALPDYRGRVPCGVDGMNSTLAGVITAASVAQPNQVGSHFGAETETLTIPQLPTITPTVTVDQGVTSPGVHTHNVVTTAAGGHNHTLHDPQHVHTYTASNINNTTEGGGTGGSKNAGGSTGATTSAASTNITIDGVGDHTHPVVVDGGVPGGSHTHVVAVAPFGSGNAHPNTQPSILGFWHIKL